MTKLALSLLIALCACRTTPEGNRVLVLQELHERLAVATLGLSDAARALEDTHPELAQTLAPVALAAKAIDERVQGYLFAGFSVLDVEDAIAAFLVASDPLVVIVIDDPETQALVRALIILTRTLFVELRALAPSLPVPSTSAPP